MLHTLAIDIDLLTPWLSESLLPVLVAMLAIAAAAGALSPMVVAGRMAFFADAVAHSALIGAAAGFLAGMSNSMPAIALAALLTGGLVTLLRARAGQQLDTLLGVAMAGALGIGMLMHQLSGNTRDLHGYLFGDLALLPSDWTMPVVVVSAVVVVLAMVVFNRVMLLAVSRDLVKARAMPSAIHEGVLVALLALAVSMGVQVAGILMVGALLVVPGAAARNLCRTVRGFFWCSVALSIAATAIGFSLSYGPSLAPGPCIMVVAVAFFAVSLARMRSRNR